MCVCVSSGDFLPKRCTSSGGNQRIAREQKGRSKLTIDVAKRVDAIKRLPDGLRLSDRYWIIREEARHQKASHPDKMA